MNPEDKICFGDDKQNWNTEFNEQFQPIDQNTIKNHKIVTKKDVEIHAEKERFPFEGHTEYQVSY